MATHRRGITFVTATLALFFTLGHTLVAVLSGQLALQSPLPLSELFLYLGAFSEDIVRVRIVGLVTLQKSDIGIGEVVLLLDPGLVEWPQVKSVYGEESAL